MTKLSKRQRHHSPGLRIFAAAVLVCCGLLVLLVKLYYEQIHTVDKHNDRVRRQTLRRIRIPADRGMILTADLQILAENRPRYDAVFYLEEMRREAPRGKTADYAVQAAEDLAEAMGISSTVTREDVIRHINLTPGLPFPAFRDLTEEQLARFYQASTRVCGTGVELNWERYYPCGSLASQLIGFVRNAEPLSASDRKEYNYYLPDAEGRSGLERIFDGMIAPGVRGLRGEPGYSVVQVDYLGYRNQELLDSVPPTFGNHIILTLEAEAQRIAERLLTGYQGAIIVMDADNGDIIAMATAPGYDANDFVPSITQARYNEFLNDPGKPLINRAISGTYMPGSIIKPLIAVAIQEAGIPPERTVDCDGRTKIGTATIRCTAVHGPVDMEKAIERSCNDYFIEMGMETGFDPILSVLKRAGLGRQTGIEIAGASGQLPDLEAFRRIEKRSWNRANTALLSIGQGMITVSPLQAVRYAAAIANGGFLVRPRLLKSVNDDHGRPLYTCGEPAGEDMGVDPAHLEVIRRGMRRVVTRGSGKSAANAAIELYGKTGTAEVGSRENRRKNVWFMGFGTHADRTYSIIVLLENEQSGGRDCAPVAAAFFLDYITP